jgi:hypothetical protein
MHPSLQVLSILVNALQQLLQLLLAHTHTVSKHYPKEVWQLTQGLVANQGITGLLHARLNGWSHSA